MNAAYTLFSARDQPKGRRVVFEPSPSDGILPAECLPPRVVEDRYELGLWAPATFKGDHRCRENVEQVYALGFDVDGLPSTALEALREILAPYEATIHSTFHHTPEAPRWRVLVKTTRLMTGAEYELAWLAFRQTVLDGVAVGPHAKDPSRGWFVPGHKKGAPPVVVEYIGGSPVDLDILLSLAPKPKPEPPKKSEPKSEPKREAPKNRPDRVTRARLWFEKAQPAVSGESGHSVAFRSIERAVRGFDLTDSEAMDALQSWNRRCAPPWSDKELLHKIQDGRAKGDTPIGSLLDEPPTSGESAKPTDQADVHILTADELFAPENPADLVVPALGICYGPPTGFVGQSWVGKTFVGVSLGLSIAAGRKIWSSDWTCRQGPWLHLDYEMGRRHTKSRVRRLARGMGISDDELRSLVLSGVIRLAIYPKLQLTDAGAVDSYARLFEGARFVTCDSLRKMIGGVDENSSQVRQLIAVTSSASDKTGAAVGIIHHAGNTPMLGHKPRGEMGRGSSAIKDEFQSQYVMTKGKGDPYALVSHEKDRELGYELPNFGLRIDDVPDGGGDLRWGARIVKVDIDAKSGVMDDAVFKSQMESVRDFIGKHPGVAGKNGVSTRMGINEGVVKICVDQLIADGSVVELKGRGNSRRLYLTKDAPKEEAAE